MSTNSDQAIALLKSIDATLKALVKELRASKPKALASDAELAGPYGDPLLKTLPRDWSGHDYRNRRYSECPPELLDLVAEMMDYFGEKAERDGKQTSSGKDVAPFNFADARRARSWAARLRAGWKPQDNGAGNMLTADEVFHSPGAPGFPSDRITEDDIPF